MQFIWIAIAVLFIWLVLITISFWNLYSHYNNLVKGVTKKTLQAIMEELLKNTHLTKKDIETLKERCDKIEKDGSLHIQKIGLLRFNPFKDTGGDQSFILSLLDGNDTGIVISGLYSRSGTRWYAKQVHYGKGISHELSDEEKKAIAESKNVMHNS